MSNFNYEIIKVMNNNVILARDLIKGTEAILIGKGLGFNAPKGKKVYIPKEKIEKSFITYDKKLRKEYFDLVELIKPEIMEVCAEIILHAEENLGKLSPRVHIVLTDHIAFALERIKKNMEITNPFLLEIKSMYKEEYKIGIKAKEMIEDKIGVKISEEEIGFITLHLNAAREHKDVKQKLKNTRLVKELVEIVERELDYKIDNNGLTYSRLINHFRGSIERTENNTILENPLLETIKHEFRESYNISKLIKKHIEKNLDIVVSDYELGYMTIHINRVKQMVKMKK